MSHKSLIPRGTTRRGINRKIHGALGGQREQFIKLIDQLKEVARIGLEQNREREALIGIYEILKDVKL